LVLGHSLVAMHLVLIIVFSALKNYDMNQEKVARSLGATRFRAFREITLPQIKFSIISASLIAFLTSFDEIIISLFVAGGDNSTITRSMFLALRDQIDPTIAAISTILMAEAYDVKQKIASKILFSTTLIFLGNLYAVGFIAVAVALLVFDALEELLDVLEDEFDSV